MSAIPGALLAAVALFQDVTDPDDVTVHDGPPTTAETSKYICVGYDPDSTRAVEMTQAPAAMRGSSGHSRKEEFEILCLLACTSGDSDIPGLRTEAFALLALIAAPLRVQPTITLNGALGSGGTAQLVSGDLDQGESSQGDVAAIRFRLRCTARV